MTTTFGSTLGELFKSPAFLTAAATPFIAIGANALQSGVSSMMESRQRAKTYKDMLDMHPELQQYKDKELMSRVFTSVARANPHVAADPFVAGAIVSNIVAGHEHVNPAEGKRMMLTEIDRLIGQRGAFKAPSTNAGQVVMDVGRAMSTSMTELERQHSEAETERQKLKRFQDQLTHDKKIEALRKAEERLQDVGTSASSQMKALEAKQRAFAQFTGIEPTEHKNVPSIRARQYLRSAAEDTLSAGFGRRKRER